MATLGYFLILAAFVLASGAFSACVAGARRGRSSLVEGGIGLFHAVTAMMILASTIIIHEFVVGNYAIKYVQSHSNAAQPLFYKLSAYWGGLDGSILFWVALLAIFGSAAVTINRERHRILIPYVVAVIAIVEMFFLFLMVVHNNPFDTFIRATPVDGKGLNPLLQNFYMVIHPPMLYSGFVGMTIPYAFGMAALITGQLDDSWLRAVRYWTMFAWLFLTVGLTLGGLWAYETLGWGGYWGWDPVENAGLLPWLTATAFLHSVMVQERRSMLKVWNVTLVITTFLLTIFGTFMTRSGVVQSVHAFGEDRALAWMFTAFILSTLVASFGIVIYRLPLLRARHELDSWISREAAFLVNNWVLLFSAFFVLYVTMYPTLSEAVSGQRITIDSVYYNRYMVPIGLILLFLTGVGPLLAWRKSSVRNLISQFCWPTLAAIVVGGVAAMAGLRFWPSGVCFALCAFVTVTILQEFIRGAAVRRRATGTDLFTALVGLFARSRRRYGGYVIHLGVVLVFIGFAGNTFDREEQVKLSPGQQTVVTPYTVRYDKVSVTQDSQKQMVTASMDISRDGKFVGHLYPGKYFYSGSEAEPVTQVAIRRSAADDLYIVLAGFEADQPEIPFKIIVNPLVNWVWMGIAVIVFGTFIALLPERTFAFAVSESAERAATASLLIIALMTGAGVAHLSAQHVESAQTVAVLPKTPLESELQNRLICMCGMCGRKHIGECTCTIAAGMREELASLTAAGKSRDEIIQYFVKKYGSQEVLGEPVNRKLNRFGWAVPYAVGALGMMFVVGVAIRWSGRRGAATPEAPAAPPADPALEARLDDELRDLD